MVVAVGTEQQQQERTFLQQLGDHARRDTTPVVDEEFIKAFSQLSWEDQCRAMNHLYWIKQNVDRVINNHEEVVYKGRIEQLYNAWLDDQTTTWISAVYSPPNDARYWELSNQSKTVSLDKAKMLLDIETASLLLDTEAALTEQEGARV